MLVRSLRLSGLPTPWIRKTFLYSRIPYLLYDGFLVLLVVFTFSIYIYTILQGESLLDVSGTINIHHRYTIHEVSHYNRKQTFVSKAVVETRYQVYFRIKYHKYETNFYWIHGDRLQSSEQIQNTNLQGSGILFTYLRLTRM